MPDCVERSKLLNCIRKWKLAESHTSFDNLLLHEMSDLSTDFPDVPVDAGRPLKVICIGCGYSGILTAIRFPQRIPNLELVIYEKNTDIGGTWYENR